MNVNLNIGVRNVSLPFNAVSKSSGNLQYSEDLMKGVCYANDLPHMFLTVKKKNTLFHVERVSNLDKRFLGSCLNWTLDDQTMLDY